MIWLHLCDHISESSPHLLHFMRTCPLAVFPACQALSHLRSLPWPVPFPEIYFHFLLSQLTFIFQGDSQRGLCLATPPQHTHTHTHTHLLLEKFLAHVVVHLLCLHICQFIYLPYPKRRLMMTKHFIIEYISTIS